MLYYDEVFYSIQGEGADTGRLCVFVRLYGCPFFCSYCDQPQLEKRKKISIENLITKIRKVSMSSCKRVCITGGEPLIQGDCMPLVYELCGDGYDVSIETSGCVPLAEGCNVRRSYRYIMDIKCPSSEMYTRNVYDNLLLLMPKDEVVFVIADEVDYVFAKKIMKQYPTSAQKVFSPLFNKDNKPVIGQELVEWLKRDKLNARIQIQLHKILGVK